MRYFQIKELSLLHENQPLKPHNMKAIELITKHPEILAPFQIPETEAIKCIQDELERLEAHLGHLKLQGTPMNEENQSETHSRFSMVLRFAPEVLEKLWNDAPSDPEVGMPCTIILWSDKLGATVTEVHRNRAGNVRRVGVRRNAHEGGVEECECSEELIGNVEYFTLRRGGGWFAEGQPKAFGSVALGMGYRRTWIDPSF